MLKTIVTHKMGKLRIYLPPSDKIRQGDRSIFRKLFPKTAYFHILEDAQSEGIMTASVYSSHSGYSNKEKVQSFTVDGDNSKLNVCIELIDNREKLERFFLRHQNHLKGKVVIFKEVQFWDAQ